MSTKISVNVTFAPFRTIVKEVVLDDTFLRIEPLDLPKHNAEPFDKMLCTDSIRIGYVMRNRKRVAKTLANELSKAIMDILATDDTIMGYKEDDNTD